MGRIWTVVVASSVWVLSGICDLPAHASPGQGALYGTDASRGNLLLVDIFRGTGRVIGPISPGLNVPSLATDPVTGIMYAGGGAGNPVLLSVDPCTGAGEFVGDSGLGAAAIGAMDFRLTAPGTSLLYASVNIAGDGGTGSDHLATIDTTTGLATVIGPYGVCMGVTIPSQGGGSCTIEGMEAIAFASDGTLYGAVNRNGTGMPGLYTINIATGAATFVAPILDSDGKTPGGGVVSLQFATDGTLFAGTSSRMGAGGGDLGTVDPITGLFTRIGNVVSGGPALGALAFARPCLRPAPTAGPFGLAVLLAVLAFSGVMALRRHAGESAK